MEGLLRHIESLIFVADQPISVGEIQECLESVFEVKLKQEDLIIDINLLINKYADDNYSMEIIEIAGGYQFLTKGAFHNTIGTFLKNRTNRRLSRSALETLSIVAYKQPVSKSDMERIRGVSCDYAIQKLLAKELVAIVGRSDGPGRPLLYGTSEKFMDYFGIKAMGDLPKPKEFKSPENTIGDIEAIEDSTTELPTESTEPNVNNVEETDNNE